MATIQNQNRESVPGNGRLLTDLSPETRQLLTLSDQKGWHFAYLGQAPLPTQPLRLDDWLVVPATQESTAITSGSYKKVQTIYANAIRPKGFVVIHEAPRQLAAPKKAADPNPSPSLVPSSQAASANANTTAAVTSILNGIFSTILLVLGALFTTVAMIDPILVAVMEDGSWVEIDRWNTKV
jgi:hypothetical protein